MSFWNIFINKTKKKQKIVYFHCDPALFCRFMLFTLDISFHFIIFVCCFSCLYFMYFRFTYWFLYIVVLYLLNGWDDEIVGIFFFCFAYLFSITIIVLFLTHYFCIKCENNKNSEHDKNSNLESERFTLTIRCCATPFTIRWWSCWWFHWWFTWCSYSRWCRCSTQVSSKLNDEKIYGN